MEQSTSEIVMQMPNWTKVCGNCVYWLLSRYSLGDGDKKAKDEGKPEPIVFLGGCTKQSLLLRLNTQIACDEEFRPRCYPKK